MRNVTVIYSGLNLTDQEYAYWRECLREMCAASNFEETRENRQVKSISCSISNGHFEIGSLTEFARDMHGNMSLYYFNDH